MSVPIGPLTYTHTQVACGATTTELAAANTKRLYLRIENVSDEIVDIKVGADAVSGEGIRLHPVNATTGMLPTVFEMSETRGNLSYAAVNGICASGSKNVNITSGQ